ncbi:MAG: hypothetical protein KGR26_15555, partial [Cyanobacteria bacterium REEB65]|nr:hypothetical protein [Cyanobacteria bacterium REEB65]
MRSAAAHSGKGFWHEFKAGIGYMVGPWAAGYEAVNLVNQAFSSLVTNFQSGMQTLDKASHTGLELASVFQGDRHAIDQMLGSAQHLASASPFFTENQIAQAETEERLLGLNADQIQRLTPELMDMAAVMGTDVDQAAQRVGMAMEGNSRALKQLGISVKAGTDPMTVLNDVLAKAAEFHHAAAKAAGTDAGEMAAIKTKAEDANEALASVLLPTVIKIEDAFISAEGAITRFLGALQNMSRTDTSVVDRIKALNLPTTQLNSGSLASSSPIEYNLAPAVARMYAGGESVSQIVSFMHSEHASGKEIQQVMGAIGGGIAHASHHESALAQSAHAAAVAGAHAAVTHPENASYESHLESAAQKAKKAAEAAERAWDRSATH